MFALMAGKDLLGGAGSRAPVLPRRLRRPARLLARLFSGEVEAPRFAATALTAVFLAATGVYGMAVGGHTSAVMQAVTARSGFAITDIRVSGNRETSEIDIIQKIGLDGWTALIGFDAAAARDRIAGLAWVETVSVRKIYPNALEVVVSEREPFAVWQHGEALTLVERDGSVIAPYGGRRHADLPLVVGLGAAERAADIVDSVARHPSLAARTAAFMRIGQRRWDIRLDNGVTLRLPEDRPEAALADIARLDRERRILSADVLAIDLRLPDRLVVRLTPEALEGREAMIEQRISARGKAEQQI